MKATKTNPGNRYNYCYMFDSKKQVHDWKHEGILPWTMSTAIMKTENEIVKYVLSIVENSVGFIMSYIDKLKNFKNYTQCNR